MITTAVGQGSHGDARGMAAELRRRVLYQDANLIILNKPSGLAVHAGPRTHTHLEGMLGCLAEPGRQVPRLAHRLDRDTSGCLVLARHDKALSRLGRLFGAGRVEKTYWAVVAGRPAADRGRIEMALRKLNDRSGWRMVPDPAGQAAVTEWRLRGAADGVAWLELSPKTGRTHQIRVHCASALGCPIIGDPVYGTPGQPLHLHSRSLVVPYWAERPPVRALAPPPPHMQAALRACGWSAETEG